MLRPVSGSGPPVSGTGILGRVIQVARTVGVEVWVYVLGPGVRLRDRITRDAGGLERLKGGEGILKRGGDVALPVGEVRDAGGLKVISDFGGGELNGGGESVGHGGSLQMPRVRRRIETRTTPVRIPIRPEMMCFEFVVMIRSLRES